MRVGNAAFAGETSFDCTTIEESQFTLRVAIIRLHSGDSRASKQPDGYDRAVGMLKDIFSDIGALQKLHNPKGT